jgi:UDP-glucuronate 4-epimerase
MRVMVTGAAGFVGHRVSSKLLQAGDTVVGVDNLNDYYDVRLKEARLAQLTAAAGFTDVRLDIGDVAGLREAFARHRPERVIHLAAQAGVRHSLTHPEVYVQSNLVGFANILEMARHFDVQHLVYASTSSVYGANTHVPFGEDQHTAHPLTLYAATKKANEVMAHSYAHLFRLPCTGLRFFTVYGPWGRPDMALFKFTRNILRGEPIELFNHGNHTRDFTYIDDIAEGVVRTMRRPAEPDPAYDPAAPSPAISAAPYRIYNIGSQRPVALTRYVELIEACVGRKAIVNSLPMQPGDVPDTFADVDRLARDVQYRPTTSVETGVSNFVAWYRDFYGE